MPVTLLQEIFWKSILIATTEEKGPFKKLIDILAYKSLSSCYDQNDQND